MFSLLKELLNNTSSISLHDLMKHILPHSIPLHCIKMVEVRRLNFACLLINTVFFIFCFFSDKKLLIKTSADNVFLQQGSHDHVLCEWAAWFKKCMNMWDLLLQCVSFPYSNDLEHCPALSSPAQKRQGSLWKSPVEGHKDDRGPGASAYEERLRNWGLFSQGKDKGL